MHSHFAVPLQLAQQHLKVAKDEVSTKEQEFHRELATARKLAQLYKEADGEKGKKVTELEGIITELQKHLKVAPYIKSFLRAHASGPMTT